MPILSLMITLIFYSTTEYDFFILLSIISYSIDICIVIYRIRKKLKKILKKFTKDKTTKDR